MRRFRWYCLFLIIPMSIYFGSDNEMAIEEFVVDFLRQARRDFPNMDVRILTSAALTEWEFIHE